jgi:pimeloyl-ACP methyl ester carboxylesterase
MAPMIRERPRIAASLIVLSVVTTLTVGIALAQNPAPEPRLRRDAPANNGKGKAKAGVAKVPKGGLRAPGGAGPKGAVHKGADPLVNALQGPEWPYHFRLKYIAGDRQQLAATFYPSRAGANAAVVMLIHDRGSGRSDKDFEEPIEELKGQSFAEYLQEQDYAVLALDLRGHGENPRRDGDPSAREWAAQIQDLQTAYHFLIDRNNRRELNLSKFGVLGVGHGANLVLAWAASSGGAVASEGRISDLGALVLVSPQEDSLGLRLLTLLRPLAPRLPILLIATERDTDVTKDAEDILARRRLSRVMKIDSRLPGDKLLRFEPKLVSNIAKFLEDPVKFRPNSEWEPRYLFNPVAYGDLKLIPGRHEEPDAAQPKAAPAPAPAKKRER